DLPAVLALLDGDHRVGDLENRPGNLVGLRRGDGRRGREQSRQGQSRDGDPCVAHAFPPCPGSYFRPVSIDARSKEPVGWIAISGAASMAKPFAIQASRPPASGRTSLNPLSISMRATRAAEASLGQVQ